LGFLQDIEMIWGYKVTWMKSEDHAGGSGAMSRSALKQVDDTYTHPHMDKVGTVMA
jgi:hypothetical protein